MEAAGRLEARSWRERQLQAECHQSSICPHQPFISKGRDFSVFWCNLQTSNCLYCSAVHVSSVHIIQVLCELIKCCSSKLKLDACPCVCRSCSCPWERDNTPLDWSSFALWLQTTRFRRCECAFKTHAQSKTCCCCVSCVPCTNLRMRVQVAAVALDHANPRAAELCVDSL